ncbi:hypothetical protein CCYA_CCYA01G0112 [Cyanidiococcus yangmingshanensis]|nr:hypothetical protein CCYA_CCYA01G0112 [Cyanidiococcus yangmingshanensis]
MAALNQKWLVSFSGNTWRSVGSRHGASVVLFHPTAYWSGSLFAYRRHACTSSVCSRGLYRRVWFRKEWRCFQGQRHASQRPSGSLWCRAVLAIGVQELASAFAGGSVGVLGTLVTLELLQSRARERKQCPYCSGRGKLVCGCCFAFGSLPNEKSPGGMMPCRVCGHSGYVPCNHCEGTGRMFPGEGDRAVLHAYEQEWLGEEP